MSNQEQNGVEIDTCSRSTSMTSRDWDRLREERDNLEYDVDTLEEALREEKKKGAELRRELDGVRWQKEEGTGQLKAVVQQLQVVQGNLEASKDMVTSLQRKLEEQVAQGKGNLEKVEAAQKMEKNHEAHLKEAADIMMNLQKEVTEAEDRYNKLYKRLIQEQEENGKCQMKFGQLRDAVFEVRVDVTQFVASLRAGKPDNGCGEDQDRKAGRDNSKDSLVKHFVEKKLIELGEIEMSLTDWVGLSETEKMVLDICQDYNSSFVMSSPKATDTTVSGQTVEIKSSVDLKAQFPLAAAGTSISTESSRGESDCADVDLGGPSEMRDFSTTTDKDKRKALPSSSLTSAVGSKKRPRITLQKRIRTSGFPSSPENHVQRHAKDLSRISRWRDLYCVCGYRAPNKNALSYHISNGIKIAKLSCLKCNRRYKYMCHLRTHLLVAHGIVEKRKGCGKCGRIFANQGKLRKHRKLSASCRTAHKKIMRVDLTSHSAPPSAQIPVIDIPHIKTELGDGSDAEDSPPILHPYYCE